MSNHKRTFQFYLPNGEIGSAKTDEDLKSLGVLDSRRVDLESHYKLEMYYERDWRNGELDKTDRCMFEDATYRGKIVRESDYYSEITAYRQALRDYDLKYMERPIRPEWFIG